MNRAILLLTLGLSLAPVLCWAAEPKAEEAKAIAEIEKLGGYVTRDEKSPDKPVISVSLFGGEDADAGLVKLECLTHLHDLNLMFTKITDTGLAHLEGLTKLQKLELQGTKVTDAGLVHLKGLTQLQSLDLDYTQVTDAGLIYLQALTELHTLHMSWTKVTDAGLVHLKGLTKLQTLDLGEMRSLTLGWFT